MTDDEHDTEIAKAAREYSENKKKIACLERRVCDFASLGHSFSNNMKLSSSGLDQYLEGMGGFDSDPRKNAADLLKLRQEQADLQKLFKAHNLDIG